MSLSSGFSIAVTRAKARKFHKGVAPPFIARRTSRLCRRKNTAFFEAPSHQAGTHNAGEVTYSRYTAFYRCPAKRSLALRHLRKQADGRFRLHVPLTHASSTKHLPRAPQEAVTRSLSSIITINSNARTRPYSGPRSPHSSHTLTAILSHASAPALAHVHEEETRRRRAARARGQIRRGARSRPRSSPGARRPSAAACCHHTACTMPMRLCVR